MHRLLGAFAVWMCALAVAPSASAQSDAPGVDAETVRTIERQIVMPLGAQSLEDYDRYYANHRIGDRNMVVGVLLLRAPYRWIDRRGAAPVTGVPNAYTMTARRLPAIIGRGCSVVTVYFDILTQRLLPVRRKGGGIETERLAICNDD